MANKTDIFDRLRQYEVQPPPGAWNALLERLQQETAMADDSQWQGAFQGLQQLEMQPPSFMPAVIARAIAETPLFAALQEMVVEPPAGAFDRILQEVKTGKGKAAGTKAKAPVRKLFNSYRAIAAVLVLVIAGWSIYYLTGTHTKPPVQVAGTTTTPGTQPAVDTAQQTLVASVPDSVRYVLYDNPHVENYFTNNRFTAEGAGLQLVENDFIVTFASYQYETLPSFLKEEEDDSKLMVRLDQYSYFSISENMMASLKKMYQRRSRGTFTRRARKEREKLEQWKKADEVRFDAKRGNPIDPIDLAEFIFK